MEKNDLMNRHVKNVVDDDDYEDDDHHEDDDDHDDDQLFLWDCLPT